MVLLLAALVLMAVIWRVVTVARHKLRRVPISQNVRSQNGSSFQRPGPLARGNPSCGAPPEKRSDSPEITPKEKNTSPPECASVIHKPDSSTVEDKEKGYEPLEISDTQSSQPKLRDLENTADTGLVSKTETAPNTCDVLPPEEISQVQTPRTIDPEKRGGRSRETSARAENPRTRERRIRTPKPEIICWKREREWILAVELPGNIQTAVGLTQKGIPLMEDESEQGCWRLSSIGGEIDVVASEVAGMSAISLGDDDYQVFKLSGQNLTEGRRIKQLSFGSYLVVVPQSWERDDQRAGVAPASPEPTSLDGYRAHFFDLNDDQLSTIAFRDASGRPFAIGARKEPFRIVGQRLSDACETQGSLFIGTIPQVQILDGSWDNVPTVVLGEEGSGRGKWRKSFTPTTASSEQLLPADLLEKKVGWYFVRFYDCEDELVDSLDFRFATGLREINIDHHGPLPRNGGHQATTVEFCHDPNWQVAPWNDTDAISIHRASTRTICEVPPTHERDLSEWKVGPRQGPTVKVVVLVERVWWALSEDSNTPPTQWQDSVLPVETEDFKATSKKMLWLRFPKKRWIERAFAGFRQEARRNYPLRATEHCLAIPLRDFGDSPELSARTNDHFLKLWLPWNGSVLEATLTAIRGDKATAELKLDCVPLTRLAHALTQLRQFTKGPTHLLLKEIRSQYRSPRHRRGDRNDEFVRRGLCGIALFLHLAKAQKSAIPRFAGRWQARAQRASKQFPETMSEVWRQYARLGGLYS